jgi:methionyl-tRNA synthetase
MNRFYITTTLPYVNAAPHLGFALEAIRADALARYHKLLGEEVFFNTGTDEHGLKLARKAEEEGLTPQAYVDQQVKHFLSFNEVLNIKPTRFIRTTDVDHAEAAQEFWKLCQANVGPDGPDIYKAKYQAKYCVGCELEKTDSELTDGHCPLHPQQEIELIDEENWFFRFSRYGEELLKLYKENPQFVVPDSRLNEIKNLIGEGLKDFSISRPKSKVSWGVPVPGDEEQVMYVWFDALVNYISTLGWPNDEKFKNFWESEDSLVVQIAGKDNLRQQAAMWQAMLRSAGVKNTGQIIIHGFITSGGEKMSKSVGNVIDPQKIAQEYGVDALRYWVLREANDFEDSDFTEAKFKESYNAHLANGLGNLVSRVAKMVEMYEVKPVEVDDPLLKNDPHYHEHFEKFELSKACDRIWEIVSRLEKYIQEKEPFKKIKENEVEAKEDIQHLMRETWRIGIMLQPLMPETSEKMIKAFRDKEAIGNLFPRK